MTMETEYKGYKITYSENGDEFVCYDAGHGMSAPTLSKIKEKIDRIALSIRKAEKVSCYELGRDAEITESDVIEYLGPKVERPWSGERKPYIAQQKIAVIARRRGSEKASRREANLSDLMPDTPEAHAALAKAQAAYKAWQDAQKEFQAAHGAIPRLNIEDVAALVKVSGLDPTGGLK